MRQFCLTFLFLGAGVGWSQTYVNPLTGSTSTHDPSIIKQGNTGQGKDRSHADR